jgi:hypothetical protein
MVSGSSSVVEELTHVQMDRQTDEQVDRQTDER